MFGLDCSECWDIMCSCGWSYRNYDIKRIENIRDQLNKLIIFKKQNNM